jgi:hypothetical protein
VGGWRDDRLLSRVEAWRRCVLSMFYTVAVHGSVAARDEWDWNHRVRVEDGL